MHVRHLTVVDFRSYESAELPLEPGVTTLVGLNGQGKTNLVEALGYLATLSSHRVATDAPLVRFGASQAVVRGAVVRDGRETMIELEITPGPGEPGPAQPLPADPAPRRARHPAHRALRARGPRAGQGRPRRAPPLPRRAARRPAAALVRGALRLRQDPQAARGPAEVGRPGAAARRSPRCAAGIRRGSDVVAERDSALHTLDVWDSHLAQVGSQLLYARLRLLRDLGPYLGKAYDEVSAGQSDARVSYKSSLREETAAADRGRRGARGRGAARRDPRLAGGGAWPGGRARGLPRRAAPRRHRADPRRAAGQGVRQPRRVAGRSRSGSSSPPSSCCGTTWATTRCSCSTTSSPSSTPGGASGSPR